MHSGERPYPCDEPGCDYSAAEAGTRVRHKREGEYADDFEEDPPSPELPPKPVPAALLPPQPAPIFGAGGGVRPVSAKHGRRGATAPPPGALPTDAGSGGADAIETSVAGAARAWTEIAFTEVELGDVLGRGASGEVRVASWRGRRVAAKSLFAQMLASDK
ncbi:hypothetical protein T492DRAFT_862611, partial [Pavlovales sp. CCMP2436]